MPADPHPVVAAYESHNDATIIAYEKQYARVTIATVQEVNDTDLSGQFGGIYIRENFANYNIDTESTGEDDGVDEIIDGGGNHWIKAVDSQTVTPKEITATEDVTIADDETADEIEINNTSGAAISVFLPDVTVRTKPITITDVGGNAATHAITVKPKADSDQTVMTGTQYIIDADGGGIKLSPNFAQTGWK